jgi:hypothetical protein
MCLCQLAPYGSSPTAEPPPAPACACHLPGIHDAEAAAGGDETLVATQGPSRVPDPGPWPPNHCPDCPVVTGLSVRVAVLADTTAGHECRPASAADWAGPLTAPAIGRGPPDPIAIPPTPLFISHCTLLI